MENRFRYLITLLLSVLICGCTIRSEKNIDGLAEDQISIIKTDEYKVSIICVDGESTTGLWKRIWYGDRWPDEVLLSPGEHLIDVAYIARRGGWLGDLWPISWYTYKLQTFPGRTYIIRHQAVSGSIRLWFEDLNTKESVGKLIARKKEPITEEHIFLDQTSYFTFKSPQNEGQVIFSRDSETAFRLKDISESDPYSIKLAVLDFEKPLSNDVFFDEYITSWKKSIDNDGFPKIIGNEMNYYLGKEELFLKMSWFRQAPDTNFENYCFRTSANSQ